MVTLRTGLAAGLLVLALAGCGSDEPDDVELGDGVVRTDDAEDRGADVSPGPDDGTPSGQEGETAAPGSGASPAPGSCVDVPPADDGVYTVADAGTVTVTEADGVLTLGDVAPADGWTHEVTSQDDDEVEVELRRDGVEVDLEVEVDDGVLRVEVCADDD